MAYQHGELLRTENIMYRRKLAKLKRLNDKYKAMRWHKRWGTPNKLNANFVDFSKKKTAIKKQINKVLDDVGENGDLYFETDVRPPEKGPGRALDLS